MNKSPFPVQVVTGELAAAMAFAKPVNQKKARIAADVYALSEVIGPHETMRYLNTLNAGLARRA